MSQKNNPVNVFGSCVTVYMEQMFQTPGQLF